MKQKPPSRKACFVLLIISNLLFLHEIVPYMKSPHDINPIKFHSWLRAIYIYFTFCRFYDFHDLRDQDFVNHGNFLEVNFRKSKNDQFYQGTNSILVPSNDPILCPVRITHLYFVKFNLNFQVTPLTDVMLSQSNATKYTKHLNL